MAIRERAKTKIKPKTLKLYKKYMSKLIIDDNL